MGLIHHTKCSLILIGRSDEEVAGFPGLCLIKNSFPEQLRNLLKTEWLWQGPSLVTFSLLLLFTLFFLISLYMDRKDSRYFPDKDKEAAFWPLKEPNKEEVEGDDLEILGFRDWCPPFPGICLCFCFLIADNSKICMNMTCRKKPRDNEK